MFVSGITFSEYQKLWQELSPKKSFKSFSQDGDVPFVLIDEDTIHYMADWRQDCETGIIEIFASEGSSNLAIYAVG